MFLTLAGHFSAGDDLLDVDVRDMTVATIGASTYLYATTSLLGGVTGYRLSTNGSTASLIDTHLFSDVATVQVASALGLLNTDDSTYLVYGRSPSDGLAGFTLSGTGTLNAPDANLMAWADPAGGAQIVMAQTSARVFVYALDNLTHTINVYDVTAGLDQPQRRDTGLSHSPLDRMLTVHSGGAPYLLTTDMTTNSVISYAINATTGVLVQAGLAGASTGLGVHIPSALEAVSAFGQTWIVLGAAGTSSISVLRLEADGALRPVDHIMDTLFTRFAGVASLAIAQTGDRVFVVAAGSDDGLSLFSLLPDGRLVHLETRVHTTGSGLQSISGLTATVSGGDIQIFVTSQTAAGITQLNIPLADISDPLFADWGPTTVHGTAGDDLILGSDSGFDLLSGLGGDDVLVSGAAGARMTGGAGFDLFVVHADAILTEITDFEAGTDRIDLSGFFYLRGAGQLDISQTNVGARIIFGGATINVRSSTDTPLTSFDLFGLGFDTPDRFDVRSTTTSDVIFGTNFSDQINGTGQDDVIRGLDGDDVIFGYAGDDLIEGGAGNDVIYGGAGDDTLYGGAGDDVIGGGPSGADMLYGHDGKNMSAANTKHGLRNAGSGNDPACKSVGADLFVFDTNDIEDWVPDLQIGLVSVVGADGTDRLHTTAPDHLNGGSNSVFDHREIGLDNVTPTDLPSEDFIFF